MIQGLIQTLLVRLPLAYIMSIQPHASLTKIGLAAYNARQIKRDMMLTLNVAILIIVAFITLSFRNKFAVLLALIPVALGALFALALMSLTCHTISSIAVGAGTVVMGIALSYSIHILCHANHCHDPRQIIRDLAYPLTIGSITTIGAFAGLLFTDSQLLRDFGLFASLTLVGTTLFSLVLLPHLIRKEKRGGGPPCWNGWNGSRECVPTGTARWWRRSCCSRSYVSSSSTASASTAT